LDSCLCHLHAFIFIESFEWAFNWEYSLSDSEVPQDEQKNDEATGEFEKESKIKNIKKEVGENKVMSSKGKEDDKSSGFLLISLY